MTNKSCCKKHLCFLCNSTIQKSQALYFFFPPLAASPAFVCRTKICKPNQNTCERKNNVNPARLWKKKKKNTSLYLLNATDLLSSVLSFLDLFPRFLYLGIQAILLKKNPGMNTIYNQTHNKTVPRLSHACFLSENKKFQTAAMTAYHGKWEWMLSQMQTE